MTTTLRTRFAKGPVSWFFILFLLTYVVFSLLAFIDEHFPNENAHDPIYWNWSHINTSDTSFPKDFLWGTATAAHQTEGFSDNNQWWEFEHDNKSRILNGDLSGLATNHWELYREDIRLMKDDLHVNAYRFSIEWSKIEPEKGVYNQTAIKHYHEVLEELLEKNIEPLVTLHHFTNPLWFNRMDSFEKWDNIDHFVNFSKFAVNEYGSKVKKWCTINEPNVYATEGYIMGHFPPAKTDLKLAFEVIKNMAEAHVRVYKAIKAHPLGKDSIVGIVLQLSQIHPYRPDNSLDRMVAQIGTAVSPGLHLDFFSTGVMSLYIPFYANLRFENKDAMKANDFFGLNYYTHEIIKFHIGIPPYIIVRDPSIPKTDMNWEIYPEGIYHAIKTVTKRLGPDLPIIITENGIADGKDLYRKEFFENYLYAVSKAIKEGHNVKGYIVWSTMDNFEWTSGFKPRFGLYEVDYNTQQRKLREGAKPFVETVRKWERSWSQK